MNRDERIRQRAHDIWEREGRPAGREAAHWEQAGGEIDRAGDEGLAGPRSEGAGPACDPDTGAALAADSTGWQPPADLPEPAAGKGRSGVIVAASPGKGATGRDLPTPRGAAARGRRKPAG